MPIYNIRGIDVDFPLQAYDCQIVYMEKVIQSLQEVCLFVFFPNLPEEILNFTSVRSISNLMTESSLIFVYCYAQP